MKRITICVGTRPNFIKVTQFERCLVQYPNIEMQLLHTGQHYDQNMSEIFFEELNIKSPDVYLNASGNGQIETIADIMVKFQNYIDDFKPHMVIVPGDVNSTLACALVANRNNIPVAHLESGLRSFDRTMPEEINRILVDDISDLFFVTEKSGLENLEREGKNKDHIYFVGNTMIDTLIANLDKIDQRTILKTLGLDLKYGLLTFHRPSNVDNKSSLAILVETILEVSKQIKLVFSIHPRTVVQLKNHGLYALLERNAQIVLIQSLGYLDFIHLAKNASFVLTDSGGIQEETTFLGVPCLTVRENTERPITIDAGTNKLLPLNSVDILREINSILSIKNELPAPSIELWDGNSTERICSIIDIYLTSSLLHEK
jgi:UDP-N-acetylglucosamine 2-epimerase (non-hydrolysing)